MYWKPYEFLLRNLECLIIEILIGLREENTTMNKAVFILHASHKIFKWNLKCISWKNQYNFKNGHMMSWAVSIPTRISNISQIYCVMYIM